MRKIGKYFTVMKISVQNQLAYLWGFISGVIVYALIIFIFINLWRVIYQERDIIAGFSYNQVIWYCIITELVIMSTGGVIFSEISSDIKGGNIGYYLNKPYNYVLYNLFNSMGLVAVKFIMIGAVGIAMGLVSVGMIQGFNPANLPFILLAILSGMVLNFLIYSAVGLTAFWFEENSAFFWVIQKILFMGGMFFPLDMMPGWLKNLALVLPFSYVTYVPARLFVSFNFHDWIWMASVQAGYMTILLLINLIVYKKGVSAINVNGG